MTLYRIIITNGKSPDFIESTIRNIIACLGMNLAIIRFNDAITQTMTALILILIQRLRYRHPAGRPEVSTVIVTQIEVTAGLIEIIEDISKDSTVCAGFTETISTGIVRDDRAILYRTQIIGPGFRCVRVGNNILSGFIIKITVFHSSKPPKTFY